MTKLATLPKAPVLHLLGAGNMPQYLFSQALSKGKASFLVTTSSAESTLKNVEKLKQQFPGARITAELSSFDSRNPSESGNSPITSIISVKPQIFKEMSNFPSSFTNANAFVVSMMAGVQNGQIKEKLDLPTDPVRIMPNLPAKVGCGVVGLLKSDDFVQDERQSGLESLLGQSSLIIDLPDEQGFHWVTAVAGSGPAFSWEVVKRIEHLVETNCKDAEGNKPSAEAVKNTAIALLTDIAQSALSQESLSPEHAQKLSTFAPDLSGNDTLLDTSAIKDDVQKEVMAYVNGVKSAALTENPSEPGSSAPAMGGGLPDPVIGAILTELLLQENMQQVQLATAGGDFNPVEPILTSQLTPQDSLSIAALTQTAGGQGDGSQIIGSLSDLDGQQPLLVSDNNLSAAIYGTLLGSARLYAESSDTLPDLQTAVRSKKGTTDAGLNVLTARGADEPHLGDTQPITEEIAKDTILAAMDRSKALSG